MSKTIQQLSKQYPELVRYRSLKESSAYLGCHVQTLRRAFRDGLVDGFKRGRLIMFRTEDLDKWMNRYFRGAQSPGQTPADGVSLREAADGEEN